MFHIPQEGNEEAAEDDSGWWCDALQQIPRKQSCRPAWPRSRATDAYHELLAKGVRYASKLDWCKAAKSAREAIAPRVS